MLPHPKNIPTSPTLRKAWDELHRIAPKGILNSSQMTRRQRERLGAAGYLEPIMRGWYRLKSQGEQTASPSTTLDFLPVYLEERLGTRWCLSAESSLVIRTNPQKLPGRLVVMAETGSTTMHTFGCGLRLTIYQDEQQLPSRMENLNGFRVMPLDTLLGRLTHSQWTRQLHLVDQLLPRINNWETMVWQWLSEERFQSTTRLALRLQKLGLTTGADTVKKALQEEGILIPEDKKSTAKAVQPSPPALLPEMNFKEVNNLQEAWNIWTEKLVQNQPSLPSTKSNLLVRFSAIEHALADDTINHLALSGFTIARDAVMQVLAEPELSADAHGWPHLEPGERLTTQDECFALPGDTDPQALVAMQGYLEALKLVKRSVVRLMAGQDLHKVLRQDVRGWRLAMMSPSAEAGLITRRQVLRYREVEPHQMEIRKSMETWVDLVAQCEPGSNRGLLGFLGILQIQPWIGGNQRLAFLILNGLNAAAGHPWIVLNKSRLKNFQSALETALNQGNPLPLAKLMADHRVLK